VALGEEATSLPAMPESDWTVSAADTVERVVGAVRDKTTVPITTVARVLVFGLLAAVLGLAAAVFLAVGLVRAVDVYTGDGRVWIAHGSVGGIFTLAGLFLLRKATARKG
jgi:hypothetical protein